MTIIQNLPSADQIYLTDSVPVDQSASGISRTAKTDFAHVLGLIPQASQTQYGTVKVGSGLTIVGGFLQATGSGGSGSNYVLPTASTSTLGGVKVDGTSITVANGVISASGGGSSNPYTLPQASTTVLGGVTVDGTTITAVNGRISAAGIASLPVASTTVLGGVKVDGTTITANNGVISSVGGSGGGSGSVGTGSLNQLAYYSASGTTVAPLTLGTGFAIGTGTLNYTPPALAIATANSLGGIKVGPTALTVDGTGILNVSLGAAGTQAAPGNHTHAIYEQTANKNAPSGYAGLSGGLLAATQMPIATQFALGGVKIDGTTITIVNGVISSAAATPYTLQPASTTTLGGVRVDGTTITSSSGTISAAQYTLPTASTVTLGGVKIDNTSITASAGVISATPYTLPVASSTVTGGIRVDNTTLQVVSGVASVISTPAPAASATTAGLVQVDGTTITAVNGVITAVATSGVGLDSLTEGSPLVGTDITIIRRGTTDYKVTIAELQAYMQSSLNFTGQSPSAASFAAGTPTTTTVPLTWTESGGTPTSRTVTQRTPSGSGSYVSATTTGLGAGAATVTGLTQGTSYDFQVVLTNGIGSSTPVVVTNVTTAVTLAAPTITSLAHGTVGTTSIPITWTEGGGAVASRLVEVKTPTGGGSYATATTTGLGAGAATITGLTASTSYDIRVTVTNATSSANTTLTNTTTAATLAAPTITSLAHGTVTATTIPLTWTEGGGAVASRTVEIKTPTGGGTYASATTTGLGAGAATITGLTASTSYDVRVTVTNATTSANAVLTNTTTAAAANDPSTIMSTPLSWWDASSVKVYTDLAQTTRATTDNAVVASIDNLLSNGSKKLALHDANASLRPLFRTAIQNGLPGLQGVATNGGLYASHSDSTSWLSSTGGDLTFLIVLKGANSVTANFTGPQFNAWYSDVTYPAAQYTGTGGTTATALDFGTGAHTMIAMVVRVNTTTKVVYLKTNYAAEVTDTYTGAASAFGDLGLPLTASNQYFFEVAVSNSFETATVRDNLLSYAVTKWGI